MLQMENYQKTTNYNLLEDSDIIDNLTSTNTDKALAANQGKILKDGMNAVFGNVKEFRAGQIILSFNGTSAQIFTKDQVDEILGVTDSGGTNVILLTQNADLDASGSKHLIAAYYNESSQKWGVHFDGTVSGGAKVNYMLVYFGQESEVQS